MFSNTNFNSFKYKYKYKCLQRVFELQIHVLYFKYNFKYFPACTHRHDSLFYDMKWLNQNYEKSLQLINIRVSNIVSVLKATSVWTKKSFLRVHKYFVFYNTCLAKLFQLHVQIQIPYRALFLRASYFAIAAEIRIGE